MSGWQQQQGGWQQSQGAGQRAPGYGQQAQGQYAYGGQQTGAGGYQQQQPQQYSSAQPTAQAAQASYGQQAAGGYGATYQQQTQGGYQAPGQQASAYAQRPGGGAPASTATGYGQQAAVGSTTSYGTQGSYGQAAPAQQTGSTYAAPQQAGSAYAAPADPRRAVSSTTYPSAQPQAAAVAPVQPQQAAYGGYAAQAPTAATAPAAAATGYGQAASGYGAAATQPAAAATGYQAQSSYGAAATQPAQQWGQQAQAAPAQPAATAYGATAGYGAPAAAQATPYAAAGTHQGYGGAQQQQQQQQAQQPQGYGAAAAVPGGGPWSGAAVARPATGTGGFVAAQSSDYAGAGKPADTPGGYGGGYSQAAAQPAARLSFSAPAPQQPARPGYGAPVPQQPARPGYGAPAGAPASGYGGRPGAGGPSQPGGFGSSPNRPSQPGGFGSATNRPSQPGGYGGSGAAAGGGGRFGQPTVSAPYREQQQQQRSSMPGFTPAGQAPSQPRVPGYSIQPPKHRADDRPRAARADVHLHPPPPPPPGGVIPGKPHAPAREDRREERPRSPVRRRSPSLDRPAPYGVRIPSHILSQASAEYREVERRYAKLYMAHDFTKVVNCWAEAPASAEALAGALLPLERPCPMDHLTAPAKQDTAYDLDHRNVAPSGSVVYNARVVLTPGLTPEDRAALLKGAHDTAGEHLSRLLKFVVARADRNGDKSGIFCLGGRCDPAVDGDPAAGDAALWAAAVRHVAAQTQLDLSGAAFKRFIEVHYTRLDRHDVEHHKEVTVIFLADASSCLPGKAQWPAVWQRQKELHIARVAADRAAKKAAEQKKKEDGDGKAANGTAGAAGAEGEDDKEEPVPEPQMPARPQLQLVGLHTDKLKLRTAAISLDGLLDYNTSDKDEGTFELSLFAEALHDALMRDAGAAILAELYKQRDAAVKRREERKRKRDSDTSEAGKKAKAEGGGAASTDAATRDGREASRDPSRSPAPASTEDKAKAEGKDEDEKKERPAARRVLSKEQLCLAFRFLDKTGAGYIRTDDLRKLLDVLGLALHHTVVKELAFNVADASGRYRSERVHYIPLCEEEVPVEAAAAAEAPAAAIKQEPAAAATNAEPEEAAAAAEVKAEPAAAELMQEKDAKPAAADLVPSFISIGGTPSSTTAGGDTDMAEGAAAAAGGGAEANAGQAPDPPLATPEKQALAAEVEALDVPGLVARDKLASLTIAQLSKYCQLHGLATSGKKADIVARVTEHVQHT